MKRNYTSPVPDWDPALKLQLPFHLQQHGPDPSDLLGFILTIALSVLSWSIRFINLEHLDAITVFLIHLTQWLTALVALIIGLLTLRKMLKEKHERP
jgi:hypothetical protein